MAWMQAPARYTYTLVVAYAGCAYARQYAWLTYGLQLVKAVRTCRGEKWSSVPLAAPKILMLRHFGKEMDISVPDEVGCLEILCFSLPDKEVQHTSKMS